MTNRREFIHRTALGVTATTLALNSVAFSSDASAETRKSGAFTHNESNLFPYFQSAPVSYRNVTMQDGFWAPRQRSVHQVSVPWAASHYDDAGGLASLKRDPEHYVAQTFAGDLESIKFIEAMATVVGVERDAEIERLIDAWGQRLIDAQGADGYSVFGYPFGADPAKRWEATWNSHEDYALGHYIESAIAYFEATGNSAMLQSARRAADNMASVFLGSNRPYAPGHPEIEHALMRLYGVTGDRKYLQLGGWLIAQRGNHESRKAYGPFSQDHMPVKDQRTIEGHAVRAAFLFNGVTEYVAATNDSAYREAVLAVWDDLVQNKLYLHGASGQQSTDNEGYSTKPNFLPPYDVYGETCAVFGNFQWAHSLFRLTGDAHYLDVAERMLYNAFYASLSLRGDRFFYRNVAETYEPTPRWSWGPVPCCPPNIVKLFSKVGGFFYSTDEQGIFVKHYGASEAQIAWSAGVKLTQRTRYPWDGDITLQVETKRPTTFALRLRVPAWAESYEVSVNGVAAPTSIQRGWLTIHRHWKSGDTVELNLRMTVKRASMPPRFKDYADLVAFQRGPIVYCLEEEDVVPSSPRYRYVLPAAVFEAEHRPELLGGVTVLRGTVQMVNDRLGNEVSNPVTLIPYGVWNNRNPGWMSIWLPTRKLTMDDFLGGDPPGSEKAC